MRTPRIQGISRVHRRVARLLLAVAGSMALVAGVSAASADSWRFAAGVRTHGQEQLSQEQLTFEFYARGSDTVLREYRDGTLATDTRCVRGTYQAANYAAQGLVVREGISIADCVRWATGSFSDGYALARDSGLTLEATVQQGGRTLDQFGGDEGSGITELVVDRASRLPRKLTRDSDVIEWTYDRITTVAGAPDFIAPDASGTETYQGLTRAEAAVGLGFNALPTRFGRFEFREAFRYEAAGSSGGTHYAFWVRDDGAEIQVVRGTGPVDADEIGAHDIGGGIQFKQQLGSEYVTVFAPDLRMVEEVRAALGL